MAGRLGPVERIRRMFIKIREDRGLTQDQVAKRAGLAERSTLANWEQGKREPGVGDLVAWARALGTTVHAVAEAANV